MDAELDLNSAQGGKAWFEWSKLASSAPARFRRYGELNRDGLTDSQAGSAALEGLAKVAWNTVLAESLTPSLQAFEISLRNYMDSAISSFTGDSEWLVVQPSWMHGKDLELVARTIEKLESQIETGTRQSFVHHDVVASVSFSLWTNMVRNDSVWSALSQFQGGKLTRDSNKKALHKTLDDVRNLRNRAYHLEPICFQGNLNQVYSYAKSMLAVLDPRLSRLTDCIDRFPNVYADGLGWEAVRTKLFVHYGLHLLAYE